jgi:hypothetical protein
MQGNGSDSSQQSSSYTSESPSEEERSPVQNDRTMPFDENGGPVPMPHFRHLPPLPNEEIGELPPPMPENYDENNEIFNHDAPDQTSENCSDGSCEHNSENNGENNDSNDSNGGNGGSHTHHNHHRHRRHK